MSKANILNQNYVLNNDDQHLADCLRWLMQEKKRLDTWGIGDADEMAESERMIQIYKDEIYTLCYMDKMSF